MSTIQLFYKRALARLGSRYEVGEARAIVQRLITEVLGMRPTDLLLLDEDELVPETKSPFLVEALERLAQGEPLQYVLGYTDFAGLRLTVAPGVLIPRPETEELVELVCQTLHVASPALPLRILDIGTGSACIPCALAHHLPRDWDVSLEAIEPSSEALVVARENVARTARDTGRSIRLRQVDLFALPPLEDVSETYGLLVSNPPYIHPQEAESMAAEVLGWEPHTALFAPEHAPMVFYEEIAALYHKGYMSPGAQIFLELNPIYAERTEECMQAVIGAAQIRHSRLLRDLSGKLRFLHMALR